MRPIQKLNEEIKQPIKSVKKRVMIGMSGGVDSSVAAALLKQRGYDVIGVTFQLLPSGEEKKSACCNLDAVSDAKRVASKLGIPHYTLNIRDEFKHHVIDYFVDTYLQGQTPNPCVECNRYIKFDVLRKKAVELGVDYVATGHYCKRTKTRREGIYNLKKAKDLHKDQTYFLYMLTSEELAYTLFPLGNYTKPEIRIMAEKFGLLNAKKKESQDICFVTKDTYKHYIEKHLDGRDVKKGFIVNQEGTVLGEHTGLYKYTIGQRKGLGIAAEKPLYVIDINQGNNTVIVGDKDSLKAKTVVLHTVTRVDPTESLAGKTFQMKTRYQMTPFLAKVTQDDGTKITIALSTPQDQISPGQSGVLYKGDRVVGGGIIQK